MIGTMGSTKVFQRSRVIIFYSFLNQNNADQKREHSNFKTLGNIIGMLEFFPMNGLADCMST